MGDLAGAEPLYRRDLEACERTLGKEHPDTLISVGNMGSLLLQMGDAAGAEAMHRRNLETRERTLGNEHPSTKISAQWVRHVLRSKGGCEVEVAALEAAHGI